MQAVVKRGKRTLTKGEMVYEASEKEGGFVATVSCQMLSAQYSGEAATSKKLAEHSAARAAIAAEFPEEAGTAPGKSGGKGMKRTHAAAEEKDSKSTLMQSLQNLLQRTVQKGDVQFETNLVDAGNASGGYVSYLTLPTYDAQAQWEGDRCDSKKLAEHSAAKRALTALQKVIAEASEAARLRKAEARKAKAARQGK